MCHDRGYLVTQDELDQTLEQFKEVFGDSPSERHPSRNDLTILVAHRDDPTGYYPFLIFIFRFKLNFHRSNVCLLPGGGPGSEETQKN
jgi:hypothetical protein